MKKDSAALEKELGDVFLHVMFYSKIAEEQGKFDIADVVSKLCEKMIYRHPHVFAEMKVMDAEEVSTNWEMLKVQEKGGNKRVLSGVPDSMPSILKAFTMQDKARGVGFDWEEKHQVWDKVKEEQGELQVEFNAMDAADGFADQSVGTPDENASGIQGRLRPRGGRTGRFLVRGCQRGPAVRTQSRYGAQPCL